MQDAKYDQGKDQGEAKICTSTAACSQFSSWAKMNRCCPAVRGGKTQTGRLVRNLAGQWAEDTWARWNSGKCCVDFYNCQDPGAAVTVHLAR